VHQTLGVKGSMLELGVYKGKSFIPLMLLKNDDEVAIAVDDFQAKEKACCGNKPKPIKPQFWKNLKNNFGKLQGHMWLWEKNSREVAQEDLEKQAPFRMVHLDASHSAEDVAADLRSLLPYLHEYGAIFVDDYGSKKWPGVKQGTDKFMKDEGKHLKQLVVRFNKAIYVTEAMYEHVRFITGVAE
jgi:hypothetical protein